MKYCTGDRQFLTCKAQWGTGYVTRTAGAYDFFVILAVEATPGWTEKTARKIRKVVNFKDTWIMLNTIC